MQSLIKEIGPAPSELSLAELVSHLSEERSRVSANLTLFKQTPAKKARKASGTTKRRKSKAAKDKEALEAIAAMGIDIDELLGRKK